MALQNYVTIHARLVYADLLVDQQSADFVFAALFNNILSLNVVVPNRS